jgi:hypothetical protein
MNTKAVIQSQYLATLKMLASAITLCPDEMWASPEYKNKFWHVAYHAIFFTHFYLHPTEADFIPWEKHKDEIVSLEQKSNDALVTLYSKDDVLEYLAYFEAKIPAMVAVLDLEAESGFYWLPFNKFEHQFYNIRHLQQHTGELCERLGEDAKLDVNWVGMVQTNA